MAFLTCDMNSVTNTDLLLDKVWFKFSFNFWCCSLSDFALSGYFWENVPLTGFQNFIIRSSLEHTQSAIYSPFAARRAIMRNTNIYPAA